MRIKTFPVAALLICVNAFVSKAQDMPPTTSLVYPGIDGKLVYTAIVLVIKSPTFQMQVIKAAASLFRMCRLK